MPEKRDSQLSKMFQFCGVKGGYLAEIQSEQESRLVASILHQDEAYWIGLTDLAHSGHYVWQHSFKVERCLNFGATTEKKLNSFLFECTLNPRMPREGPI